MFLFSPQDYRVQPTDVNDRYNADNFTTHMAEDNPGKERLHLVLSATFVNLQHPRENQQKLMMLNRVGGE